MKHMSYLNLKTLFSRVSFVYIYIFRGFYWIFMFTLFKETFQYYTYRHFWYVSGTPFNDGYAVFDWY